MMQFGLDDDATLEKFISSLSDGQRQVLAGFPLTVDKLMEINDTDELNQLKIGNGLGLALTAEQQAQRYELIEKIMYLLIFAIQEDVAKRNKWYGYRHDDNSGNGNGKQKPKEKEKPKQESFSQVYRSHSIIARSGLNISQKEITIFHYAQPIVHFHIFKIKWD